MNLDAIRKDLVALQDHEVILHGSVLTDHFTPRSDVDVAVITRSRDDARNRATWMQMLGRVPDRYDVRVFELLPLPIQAQIARRHQVVFGDPVEISYYLYGVRRTWKDQEPRMKANRFTGFQEMQQLRGNRP